MANTLKVTSPYDGSLLRELPWTSESEIEEAVARGYSARHKVLAKHQRIAILESLAQRLSMNLEDFARLIAQEGGKPIRDARVEAERAVQGVKAALAALYQWHGREIPMGLSASSTQRIAFTRREPLGLGLAISAFNHPLNLLVHQIIPGLAVGCPFLLKPSLKTPLTAIKFIETLRECGLPPDFCQLLLIPDSATARLVSDSRLSLISFIGSASVGWQIRSKVPRGAHCLLEHGGTAPAIIASDAKWEQHLPGLIRGSFYHAGQVCVSVQNIFVHASLWEAFCGAFVKAACTLHTGDPLDPTTDIGPMIHPQERARIQAWTAEAIQAGANSLLAAESSGYGCLSPTVLSSVPSQCAYFRDELFGPAVGLYPYQQESELVALLNQSRFAFQTSLFTQDIDRALSLSEKLEASTILINEHTAFRSDWMPFGGYKDSGLGLGGILESFREYSREKLLIIRSPEIS